MMMMEVLKKIVGSMDDDISKDVKEPVDSDELMVNFSLLPKEERVQILQESSFSYKNKAEIDHGYFLKRNDRMFHTWVLKTMITFLLLILGIGIMVFFALKVFTTGGDFDLLSSEKTTHVTKVFSEMFQDHESKSTPSNHKH